ncbi:MAG: hypothetical protein LBV02_09025, partial [Bacteroidales bacterium]|nr:hypothetical protein [Bacteroidales bacterium]
MIQRIRNSRITKIVSLFMAINFVLEFLSPLQGFALTGGPTQPEMAGFTPIDSDNMVDLFSGDFHYTIPLMTVPGPNGAYPVHLNYNSGPGMEQEASWVGLGWNLNPGAINREVRGIPDDFKEDKITKLHTQRDNNTFVFTHGGAGEISGIDPDIGFSISRSFIYNTYAGISLHQRYGISGGYTRKSTIEKGTEKPADTLTQKVAVSLNLDLSSDNGMSPSFGISGKRNNLVYGATFGFNSKSGSYHFNTHTALAYSPSAGISYSNASYLPAFPVSFHTQSYGLGFKIGGEIAFLEGVYNISASVSVQSAPFVPESKGSYGLLYMENATEEHLQDMNREKEMGVSQNSLNLPLPVMTHDIYAVTGELMQGSFRAYRSDVGYFTDTKATTSTSIVDINLEAATAGGFQFGGGGNAGATNSYTGGWDSGTYPDEIGFKDKRQYAATPPARQSIDPVLYEPFYFKMSGEQTANEKEHIDYLNKEKPVSFPLFFKSIFLSFKSSKDYHAKNPLKGNPVRSNREKRTSNIEYKFGGDTRAGRKGHHISEFTISNADGTRFQYGKTLYNQMEREVTFSLEMPYSLGLHSTVHTGYQAGWASPETRNRDRVGKEKLYTSTEVPPYAYSYLLTSITGYDYVDLDGVAGPSAGDAGHWVKFSYQEPYADYYRWRFPYEGANFIAGEVSNKQDDKGSYTYGTKEIAYLDVIETQTHYAQFYTSPRRDALEVGPSDDHIYKGGKHSSSKSLHKLDSIRLYSKKDPGHPLQTVIFEYDSLLCKNIPNHRNYGQGKLTLSKVYITYGDSHKGMDNPYVFKYGTNPSYNATMMDRWGNYKGNANYFDHYVSQDGNSIADAWSLRRIILPSGGSIEVDYENDDYAYVQDKQAMYMEKITKLQFEQEGYKYYVSFKTDPAADPKDYVKGFKNNLMYFKIAVRSNVGRTSYPDYISGYVRINPDNVISSADKRQAKVEVLPFSIYSKRHPFVVVCYQYLKEKRPDLLFGLNDIDDNTSDVKSFFKALISGGKTAMASAMFGDESFYQYCSRHNYFPYWETQNQHTTSYVRLNKVDKIKRGGGYRVKEIRVNDHWTKGEPGTYTRAYYYRIMENGKLISSGVAENEPAVCGEENCMRYAIYNEVKGLFYKQDDTYSELPYGESYFPGARVGYSQVITRTRVPDDVTLAAPGIQVSRFHTAKDFPVKVDQTNLETQTDRPNLLSILGSGFKQAKTSGYSQGYSIQLNDMHGKQKSVATYPFQELLPGNEAAQLAVLAEASGYVSKVEYKYKTKISGRASELDNEVDVLLGDNVNRKMKLGETYDFVVDLRQNRSSGSYFGLQANAIAPVYYPPVPIPVVMPSFDAHEEIVRS